MFDPDWRSFFYLHTLNETANRLVHRFDGRRSVSTSADLIQRSFHCRLRLGRIGLLVSGFFRQILHNRSEIHANSRMAGDISLFQYNGLGDADRHEFSVRILLVFLERGAYVRFFCLVYLQYMQIACSIEPE